MYCVDMRSQCLKTAEKTPKLEPSASKFVLAHAALWLLSCVKMDAAFLLLVPSSSCVVDRTLKSQNLSFLLL